MNRYEEKQQARKERYEDRAAQARTEAEGTYAKAKSMAQAIPFGQPILVGHHSESRDRNFRSRIHNTYGKAFALNDKAEHYANKAAAVGTGGISSDDPDAIKKLRAELESLEKSQQLMKDANAVIRKHKTLEARTAALVDLGMTAEQAAECLTPDHVKRIGFPPYQLSNNNANARRIRLRIEQLEKLAQRENKEEAGQGYTYREDTEELRVMFVFPGKPDEATRTILKRHAFKWSPTRNAWVRQLNNSGLYAAKCVRAELDKAEPSA